MTALSDLDQELRRIGDDYSGTWTYALTDIASGEQIGCGQDEVMPTASLIKVPMIAFVVALAAATISLATWALDMPVTHD